MLFLLIGLIAFGGLGLLVALFSLDYWLGFSCLFLMIIVLILIAKKLLGAQNQIENREIELFKTSLNEIYGNELALKIQTMLLKSSPISRARTLQVILVINEQFKMNKPGTREGLSTIITSVESFYGKEHPSLQKLKAIQADL